MYEKGPHIVLRRAGVCIVAKTPDGDMPQIEYWGRDFAFDTAGDALRQLDMMTLKVQTPREKPDAATDAGFVVSGALLKNIGLQIPPLWPPSPHMEVVKSDTR